MIEPVDGPFVAMVDAQLIDALDGGLVRRADERQGDGPEGHVEQTLADRRSDVIFTPCPLTTHDPAHDLTRIVPVVLPFSQ